MKIDHRLVAALTALTLTGLTAAWGGPPAPARADRSVSPYAGADGVLDIMPLGDSITRGHGDPAWRGYRTDLRARLSAVGAEPNYVGPWRNGDGDNNHAGTSGARIDQINVQVPQLMTDYRPDVVLVMVGTNDVGQAYEIASARARIGTLVGRVRQFRPSARVFVATVPAWANPERQALANELNDEIRAAVAAAADPKVSLVPNHIVGQAPERDLTDDGVHPSTCGYAKLAFVWWLYLDGSDVNPDPGSWPGGVWPWAPSAAVCSAAALR